MGEEELQARVDELEESAQLDLLQSIQRHKTDVHEMIPLARVIYETGRYDALGEATRLCNDYSPAPSPIAMINLVRSDTAKRLNNLINHSLRAMNRVVYRGDSLARIVNADDFPGVASQLVEDDMVNFYPQHAGISEQASDSMTAEDQREETE